MMDAVIFDNEIKIWWPYHSLEEGQRFAVSLNDEIVDFTNKSHFSIKGLSPDTEYLISVSVVDSTMVDFVAEDKYRTKKAKSIIDVTLPPYNAVGDGVTLNTKALQHALNDCSPDQLVYIPDGVFLTGALDMKSDTELLLSDNATLQGSTDPKQYLPKIKSRFEGVEMLCYRSLINTGKMDNASGINCENITIRGGKILGGGNELRSRIIAAERKAILKQFGYNKEASPPAFYSTYLPGRMRGRTLCCCNTKNVVVANTFIGNSPAWNLHFIYCEDVVTCSCEIFSHKISNGDGWNPDSSKNCTIFDVNFDTGDDCVAIKSGKNLEGYKIGRPCEHIKIFDCYAKEGHGFAIGSEISGGINDVTIWNCFVRYGNGIYLKTARPRGGYINDVKIYNCNVPTISACNYVGGDDGDPAPTEPFISNLHIEDVTLNGVWVFTSNTDRYVSENALGLFGHSKEYSVKNVFIKNVTLKYRQMLPYQMFGLNNVENLVLENIICKGEL